MALHWFVNNLHLLAAHFIIIFASPKPYCLKRLVTLFILLFSVLVLKGQIRGFGSIDTADKKI